MTDLAGRIDHTVLASEATIEKIEQLCDEALRHHFRSVFVQPCRVSSAVDRLRGTEIKVGSVAGFPFGADLPEAKAAAAAAVISLGADEVDMVMNIGALKDGRFEEVKADISGVVAAAGEAGGGRKIIVKVIIETCLLTEEEKKRAALLAREAGADYVKTSTGYMGGGATAEDVRLLRRVAGSDFGVKASGGVRTFAQALEMVEAGADLIGTSSGVAIMQGTATQTGD